MNKIIEFIKKYFGEILTIIGTGFFVTCVLDYPNISDTGPGAFGAMLIVLGIIIRYYNNEAKKLNN